MTAAERFIIRPLEARDESAIARLWAALTEETVAMDARLPGAMPGAAADYARRMQQVRVGEGVLTLVAEVNGSVVGYVLGQVVNLHPDLFQHVDAGYIADLYVEGGYRRLGIGRLLVATITRWFATQGVTHVELMVAARNETGRRFWEAVGGSPVMLRMRLPLEPGQ